ncbi:uncharacterized protein LOC144000393 [Lithobates pipiens]
MTPEDMKVFVETFSLNRCRLGNQGYNRVLIQLFGYLGHGKSAFINSCKYVLGGEFRIHAEERNANGALSLVRRSYRLTDGVALVDNRGLPTADWNEVGLIYAHLGNLISLEQRIEWPGNYNDIMTWIMNNDLIPNYTDFIVPVLIYSVTMTASESEIATLRTLLENAEQLTGIKPFVVLTHKSRGGLTEVRSIFEDMGINYIFQVENYTQGNHSRVRATHEEILKFLYEVLKDVECRMETRRNPLQERIDRMKFILDFAHKKEMEMERGRNHALQQAQQRRAREDRRCSIM